VARTPDISTKATLDPKDFEKGARAAAKATRDMQRQIAAEAKASEQSFKNVAMVVAKIGAALLVAQKAFQLYGKVMESTHGTADAFEITMSKIKFSIAEIVRSVATGGFKGLADRMREAADNGQRLAEQLDYVFELSLRLKLVTADTELAMARQQLIYRDKRNPYETRVAAATEYLRLVKVLEAEQIAFTQEEVKGAMLQSGVAASGLSPERLKYYQMNATLLKENEEAVISYLKALKDLQIQQDQQTKQPVSAATAGIAGTTVYQSTIYAGESVDVLKAKIAGASSVVKDFASDYEQWLLVIDPEKTKLIESWAKLSDVQKQAAMSAAKPLRTVGQLLNEEQTAIENTTRAAEDYVTVWNSMVFPERTKQPALPGTSGITELIPKDYTLEIQRANEELMRMSDIGMNIAATFENLFSAGLQGWDEFGKAAIRAIEMMMVKLAAMGALYLALSFIPGFAGFMEFVGKISDFANGSFIPGKVSAASSGGGGGGIALKGRDLAWANYRSGGSLGRIT
jgi:hypothetical protein